MIPTTYLNELAQYTDDKIAKVVINETYEVESFLLRELSGNLIELEFMIPLGAVSDVTLIELQSEDGQTISTNTVFVPITTDTMIRQTIQVKGA